MEGRIQHSVKSYIKRGKYPSHTQDAILAEYDGYVSYLLHSADTWRFIAIFSMVLFIGCIIVLAITATLPKTELVVVGVNDVGEARYYGKAGNFNYDGYDMKESIVGNILTLFIERTYTISADNDYMVQEMTKCLYFLPEGKRRAYNYEINERDPFSLVGLMKQEVKIETIIPVSENVYQVDWYTIQKDVRTLVESEKKWRGLYTLIKLNSSQYNSLNEEERTMNPMGIYIKDYTITEVKK